MSGADSTGEQRVGDTAESHRQLLRGETEELAVAPSLARKRRRSDCPRRGSVPDTARLRQTGFGAALEGAYLLEDRAATRSFSRPGPAGGPRLRVGGNRTRDTRPEGQPKPRGRSAFERARSSRRRPTIGRQGARRRRRDCRSAGAMASGGSTGHRSRNLWPDRQESPGNPGGSDHRSKSRDREKSLLRRGYASLMPCSMVRKGSSVRVRQRALAGFPGILLMSWA